MNWAIQYTYLRRTNTLLIRYIVVKGVKTQTKTLKAATLYIHTKCSIYYIIIIIIVVAQMCPIHYQRWSYYIININLVIEVVMRNPTRVLFTLYCRPSWYQQSPLTTLSGALVVISMHGVRHWQKALHTLSKTTKSTRIRTASLMTIYIYIYMYTMHNTRKHQNINNNFQLRTRQRNMH